MSTVRVRPAELDDAAGIAALQGRSWEAAYRGLKPDTWLEDWDDARRLAAWRRRLTVGATVWAAEDADDALAGFCAMALPTRDADGDEDTAEIGAFYVDPTRWRDGVGAALMTTALAQTSQRGFSEITLWVFEANAAARAFYARFGFTPDGGRQTPSGEPPEIRLRRAV